METFLTWVSVMGGESKWLNSFFFSSLPYSPSKDFNSMKTFHKRTVFKGINFDRFMLWPCKKLGPGIKICMEMSESTPSHLLRHQQCVEAICPYSTHGPVSFWSISAGGSQCGMVSALPLWKQTHACFSLFCSYAIADNSYRSLRTERKDQCILISGESGAGKTEATKKILQYYAVTCPASQQVETVKDRLLQSNPVLEVSLESAALELDIESGQQYSHFPIEGVEAAGPCWVWLSCLCPVDSISWERRWADHQYCTQGNPSVLPSQRNGHLLPTALGPFMSTRNSSGVTRLQEKSIWSGKSPGVLPKLAKPEIDTSVVGSFALQ